MEDKKQGIGSIFSSAGKRVKQTYEKVNEKVVSAADKNDDGKLGIDDVSAVAGKIGTAVKNKFGAVRDSAEARAGEQEKESLNPIFPEDLGSGFRITKLIRVTEIDKKRAESELCKGSVGYLSEEQDFRVVNIFSHMIEAFGLSFYPDLDSEVYYVDPTDKNRYIALDDYFSYLKVVRINELQKIAQDLGAKHFKVTYIEQEAYASSADISTGIGGKFPLSGSKKATDVGTDVRHQAESSSEKAVEIAAEMTSPGHEPIKPTLVYLKNEPSIQSLIALRMDENSPITHQKYVLKLSSSSGIKNNDAVKIDAALKAMKCSGHIDVAREARNEARRLFEYEVDF